MGNSRFCAAWSPPSFYKRYWNKCGHRRSPGKGRFCTAHARLAVKGQLVKPPPGAPKEPRDFGI